MVPWACRDSVCAWRGPGYRCVWDGFLSLCCPCCGGLCDPVVSEGQTADTRGALWSGAGLLALLSLGALARLKGYDQVASVVMCLLVSGVLLWDWWYIFGGYRWMSLRAEPRQRWW